MGNDIYVVGDIKNKHDVAIQKRKLEYEAKKPQKIWTGDRERILTTLIEYEMSVANAESYRKKAEEELPVLKSDVSLYMGKLSDAKGAVEFFNFKRKLNNIRREENESRKKYEKHQKEIQKAYEKTSVHHNLIPKFLSLMEAIAPAVAANKVHNDQLGVNFDTFYQMISRDCVDELSIKTYFEKKKLERFLPALEMEGMSTMEDLECEDDDEFNEILGILQSAVDAAKEQKVDDDEVKVNNLANDIKSGERKRLKKICMKPEKWQQDQKTKVLLNKKLFSECSPSMVRFFDEIHFALNEATQLLQIGSGYNAKQHLALENTVLDDDDDNKDCIISANVEMEKIQNDNRIMKKHAMVTIKVVESMEEVFVASGNAKTFAIAIQNACMNIVGAQFTLRKSVALARQIAKLKPANITKKSKPVWDAVDKGCVEIYNSTINMAKVSAQYFGFFLRFKQSFARYQAAMEMDPNCNFTVSLEYLRADLQAFLKFKLSYDNQLLSVKDNGEKCIKECIEAAFGATNFLESCESRDAAKAEYMVAKEKAAEKEFNVHKKYMDLKEKENDIAAELAKKKCMLEIAENVIKNKNTAHLEKEILRLQKQLEFVNDYKMEIIY